MTDEFHKPTQYSGDKFDTFVGGEDPAQISRIAHETAQALLNRVRENPEADIVERLVAFTDQNGIDAVAELWARANPRSLPGALWRIYLVRALVRQDAEGSSFIFQRGSEIAISIDPVVAGAPSPTGPEEIMALADQILRGLFAGDFAVALDRGAAFCQIMSLGCTSLADDSDVAFPERATELTTRALRFSQTAAEFTSCARLWRAGTLD
jgi:hypothetical protein